MVNSNYFRTFASRNNKNKIIMVSVGQIIALVVVVAILVAIPKVISKYAPKEYKKSKFD